MAERFFARATKLEDVGRFMTDLIDNQGVVGSTITTTPVGIGSTGYVIFTFLNDIPVVATEGGATVEYEYGTSEPDWSTLVAVTDGDHASGYDLDINTTAVDMDTIGTFAVLYTATDSSGNVSDTHSITITIVDTTVPVITASDEAINTSDMEVEGYVWTSSATALDGYDGDITADMVATYFKANGTTSLASIALMEADLYAGLITKVKYNVDDSSDNSAVEVIITITPTDTTPPIMTIIGATADVVGADVATWDPDALYVASVTDNVDGAISAVITFKEEDNDGSAITSLANARTYLGTEGNAVYCIYNANDTATNDAVTQYGTVTAVA